MNKFVMNWLGYSEKVPWNYDKKWQLFCLDYINSIQKKISKSFQVYFFVNSRCNRGKKKVKKLITKKYKFPAFQFKLQIFDLFIFYTNSFLIFFSLNILSMKSETFERISNTWNFFPLSITFLGNILTYISLCTSFPFYCGNFSFLSVSIVWFQNEKFYSKYVMRRNGKFSLIFWWKF